MNISRLTNLSKTLKILQPSYKAAANPLLVVFSRSVRDSQSSNFKRNASTLEGKVINKEDTVVSKLLGKLSFMNVNKSKLNAAGYVLYESIADGINYFEFFNKFSLPDTFYSWFTVTELHIWILMLRCMAEDEEGKIVRNRIVDALWNDVKLRARKIGAINPSGITYQLSELSEQFQAALLSYDEGLHLDDTILAAAIWRRMYQQRDVDPENLECLVKYARQQIANLDIIPKETLFSTKPIKWLPLKNK